MMPDGAVHDAELSSVLAGCTDEECAEMADMAEDMINAGEIDSDGV
jgi:hypothetical protein